MKKIKYSLNKKEKFVIFLFIIFPFSFKLLFSFGMSYNKIFSTLYDARYIFYFCSFLFALLILFVNKIVFIAKFDGEKIIIKSPIHRIKKELFINSVKKIKIDRIGIHLLGIKNDEDYKILIPFKTSNFLVKYDFLYIISIFKNIEIIYDKITYEEVLELLTNKRSKKQALLLIIMIIGLIYLIGFSLFFSFIFFLCSQHSIVL